MCQVVGLAAGNSRKSPLGIAFSLVVVDRLMAPPSSTLPHSSAPLPCKTVSSNESTMRWRLFSIQSNLLYSAAYCVLLWRLFSIQSNLLYSAASLLCAAMIHPSPCYTDIVAKYNQTLVANAATVVINTPMSRGNTANKWIVTNMSIFRHGNISIFSPYCDLWK